MKTIKKHTYKEMKTPKKTGEEKWKWRKPLKTEERNKETRRKMKGKRMKRKISENRQKERKPNMILDWKKLYIRVCSAVRRRVGGGSRRCRGSRRWHEQSSVWSHVCCVPLYLWRSDLLNCSGPFSTILSSTTKRMQHTHLLGQSLARAVWGDAEHDESPYSTLVAWNMWRTHRATTTGPAHVPAVQYRRVYW